ncbi:MAG: hypothetical protein QXQ94_11750, partial [Candidatus Bathyarchaeia archaeon]
GSIKKNAIAWYAYTRKSYKNLKTGVAGDATKATREKGEKIATVLVERISEIIEEIKRRYPPGVPFESE